MIAAPREITISNKPPIRRIKAVERPAGKQADRVDQRLQRHQPEAQRHQPAAGPRIDDEQAGLHLLAGARGIFGGGDTAPGQQTSNRRHRKLGDRDQRPLDGVRQTIGEQSGDEISIAALHQSQRQKNQDDHVITRNEFNRARQRRAKQIAAGDIGGDLQRHQADRDPADKDKNIGQSVEHALDSLHGVVLPRSLPCQRQLIRSTTVVARACPKNNAARSGKILRQPLRSSAAAATGCHAAMSIDVRYRRTVLLGRSSSQRQPARDTVARTPGELISPEWFRRHASPGTRGWLHSTCIQGVMICA